MSKIILTEKDIKGVSILNDMYFAIRSKRAKNNNLTEEEREAFGKTASALYESQGLSPTSSQINLMQKVLTFFASDIYQAIVLLKLPDKLVKVSQGNNEVIDLSVWKLSSLEPLSMHYGEDENRWISSSISSEGAYEFDTDRLEPFNEYEEREIAKINDDNHITFSSDDTCEQVKEKILNSKKKK